MALVLNVIPKYCLEKNRNLIQIWICNKHQFGLPDLHSKLLLFFQLVHSLSCLSTRQNRHAELPKLRKLQNFFSNPCGLPDFEENNGLEVESENPGSSQC